MKRRDLFGGLAGLAAMFGFGKVAEASTEKTSFQGQLHAPKPQIVNFRCMIVPNYTFFGDQSIGYSSLTIAERLRFVIEFNNGYKLQYRYVNKKYCGYEKYDTGDCPFVMEVCGYYPNAWWDKAQSPDGQDCSPYDYETLSDMADKEFARVAPGMIAAVRGGLYIPEPYVGPAGYEMQQEYFKRLCRDNGVEHKDSTASTLHEAEIEKIRKYYQL